MRRWERVPGTGWMCTANGMTDHEKSETSGVPMANERCPERRRFANGGWAFRDRGAREAACLACALAHFGERPPEEKPSVSNASEGTKSRGLVEVRTATQTRILLGEVFFDLESREFVVRGSLMAPSGLFTHWTLEFVAVQPGHAGNLPQGWLLSRKGDSLSIMVDAPFTGGTDPQPTPAPIASPGPKPVNITDYCSDLSERRLPGTYVEIAFGNGTAGSPSAESVAAVLATLDHSPSHEERVARALFETDPRVIAIVTKVSECEAYRAAGKNEMAADRYRDAMIAAWGGDWTKSPPREPALRKEAEARAALIMPRLRGR